MRGAFPANYIGGVWNGWRPGWVWLRRSCHSNRRELVFDRKRRIRKKLLHLHIANSSQWSSVCVCVLPRVWSAAVYFSFCSEDAPLICEETTRLCCEAAPVLTRQQQQQLPPHYSASQPPLPLPHRSEVAPVPTRSAAVGCCGKEGEGWSGRGACAAGESGRPSQNQTRPH